MFDTFAHFTKWFPRVCLVLGIFYIYLRWRIYYATAPELYWRYYWYVCASYNGVCIYMFLHNTTLSILLCLCMLYNLTVGYTSSWYSVIYPPCAWVVPPLNHFYICVCINLVVNFIYGILSCTFPVYYFYPILSSLLICVHKSGL